MKKILGFLFAIFLVHACSAQQATQQRAIIVPPSIQVNNLRKGESPIKVSDVKIDMKVVGAIAVTTVDMVFYNPNNRVLEGELQFPLGEGQNISRFALDINGSLREGVVVEKAKGQQVFESVIRQKIDPGLLEKTQGNNFKARIYPLPAKGTRRIVIAYEQELTKENSNYKAFLPVDYRDTLKTFELNLCVFGNDIAPNVDETPWGKFSFDKSGEAYIASYKAEDYPAKGQLVFSVPDKNNNQVFVEKGRISGETVFYAQVDPAITNRAKQLPSAIALFWDASMSMQDRKLDAEIALLENYFIKIRNVNIDLHTFNCISMPVKTFAIRNGNWAELKKFLKSITYDGATQLGGLDFSKVKADEILLLSDGLSNFGKNIPVVGKIPVITISSSLKADYSMLQYLASVTGGKYINLMQQSADEASKLLLQDSYRFISADYNQSEIKEFTTSSVFIKPTSVFSVAGKLNSDKAIVTLHFGIGNEVLSSKKVIIDRNSLIDYDNITERIWAEKKIDELDLLYDKNKKEIGELGRKYNIVTRNTSLIVLDRIEDYVQNEIVPPADLLEEYNRQLDNIHRTKFDRRKSQIDNVISMFDRRKEWWNRKFPKNKIAKRKNNVYDIISVDESTDDIVEIREHRVMADQAPPREEAYMFIAPVIAKDEEVQEEALMVMEDVKSEDQNKVKEELGVSRRQSVSKIQLKGWNPNTPYLRILKEKTNSQLYSAYLDIRDDYKDSPSFYLDVATLFEDRGMKQEALVILSNLAELEVENYRLQRVLAHRLQQLGYTEYAISQFEVVMQLRPEEPQSYRDLALAKEQDKQYQHAIELLYEIISRSWDRRFPEIEVIAVEEMNKVIAQAARERVNLSLDNIDKRLIYNMPVDIRIVLNWDTDNSDMDLWVTDPYGEKCAYDNTLTHIGGAISRDFTGGYGPEEFLIKQAVNGMYKIQANYYGSTEQTLIGPTTIYLDIYTRFSDNKEKKETITLRLTENKEIIDIGQISFSNK
ncbi:MAG: DUF2135 domain-containing protein [Prevotella sp.]|jgi:tetratricopeptide (TPR) repeat protein|nr:DUF2135 domain-containing protein [Prevotella sp.]